MSTAASINAAWSCYPQWIAGQDTNHLRPGCRDYKRERPVWQTGPCLSRTVRFQFCITVSTESAHPVTSTCDNLQLLRPLWQRQRLTSSSYLLHTQSLYKSSLRELPENNTINPTCCPITVYCNSRVSFVNAESPVKPRSSSSLTQYGDLVDRGWFPAETG